jgi:hypothetical protein
MPRSFPDELYHYTGIHGLNGRVIDESGEDYFYPSDYFIALTLLREVERAFSAAGRQTDII